MEKTFARVEELADTVKEYVNARTEAIKLQVAEKTSRILANLIAFFIVAGLFLMFFVFASIALALAIGLMFGKTWAGFLIVALLYLVLVLLVWIGRSRIIQLPIMNFIIRDLFRDEYEDD